MQNLSDSNKKKKLLQEPDSKYKRGPLSGNCDKVFKRKSCGLLDRRVTAVVYRKKDRER